MPVKIRLARHGRKRSAFYHIVVADSRAPRDGKYIERIGSYNPNTNPATIDLNFDKALTWLGNGAQPTDTVRAILSYKGVMMKKHLVEGVKKGAFDEAEAEKRFQAWVSIKEEKIQAKIDGLAGKVADKSKDQLERETKVNAERAEAINKRKSDLAAEIEAAKAAKAAEAEAAKAAKAAKEAPAAEVKEAPVAEAKEEQGEAAAEEPTAE